MQLLNFSGQKKWQRDSCISKGVPIPKVSSPISLQGHLNDKIRVYCLDIGDCPFINTKDMFLRACCVAVVISVCLSAPAPREIRRGLFSEMFGEGLQMFGGIAHTFVNGVEHAVDSVNPWQGHAHHDVNTGSAAVNSIHHSSTPTSVPKATTTVPKATTSVPKATTSVPKTTTKTKPKPIHAGSWIELGKK